MASCPLAFLTIGSFCCHSLILTSGSVVMLDTVCISQLRWEFGTDFFVLHCRWSH